MKKCGISVDKESLDTFFKTHEGKNVVDSIAAGSSEWNDVGYIQTRNTARDNEEEPTDDNNLGISSLNKQK